jgi:hypothetical protein
VPQVQWKHKEIVTSVQQAIAIAGKPDHGLDLEITESMIMEVSAAAQVRRDAGLSVQQAGARGTSARTASTGRREAVNGARCKVQGEG